MQQLTQSFPLGTVLGSETVVAFDAENQTSDAGAILLGRIDERLRLCTRLASAIHDRRNLAQVTHPLATLLRQRISPIAQGREDGDDADTLRHDPAFMLACGRLPVTGVPLASQPTFSRLENSVDSADLERLRDALLDLYLDSGCRIGGR